MAPASFGWLPPAVNCCATYCLHPVPDDALREMQSRQEAIDIHAPGAPPVTAGNRTGGSSHICPRRWRRLHIRTGAINPRWALCLCFNQFFFFFFYPLLNWHLHWASFNSLKKNTATVSSSIKVVFYQDKHTGGATDWKKHTCSCMYNTTLHKALENIATLGAVINK